MKTNQQKQPCSVCTAAAVALLAALLIHLAAPAARAALYTWDTATGNSTITDGAGTWQVGVGNWRNNTTYDQNWANGNDANPSPIKDSLEL